jgi:hypothetical protein
MKANGNVVDEVWQKAQDSRWLLFLLDRGGVGTPQLYRAFAHRCAERALPVRGHYLLPSWQEVLDAVQACATGAITKGELQRIGERLGSAAIAAGSIGLRVGDPGAALLLAIHHATNPCAFGASLFASRYGAEAFRMKALRSEPDCDRRTADRACMKERKEQADTLRELAGRPFAGGVAGDRFDGLPLEDYLRRGYLPDPHFQLDGLALFAPVTHRPWVFVRSTSHGLRRVATVPADVS